MECQNSEKLEQLTHAMGRYHWNIVEVCEMRWKNFGEMSIDDGHKMYFSGEDRHEYGVEFLLHKDVVDAVLGCRPISSRLRAVPFNITNIQDYAPISGHDDIKVDHFYQKLKQTIDQTPKKDIPVLQRGLECLSWEGCTGRPGRGLWTLLQGRDK